MIQRPVSFAVEFETNELAEKAANGHMHQAGLIQDSKPEILVVVLALVVSKFIKHNFIVKVKFERNKKISRKYKTPVFTPRPRCYG